MLKRCTHQIANAFPLCYRASLEATALQYSADALLSIQYVTRSSLYKLKLYYLHMDRPRPKKSPTLGQNPSLLNAASGIAMVVMQIPWEQYLVGLVIMISAAGILRTRRWSMLASTSAGVAKPSTARATNGRNATTARDGCTMSAIRRPKLLQVSLQQQAGAIANLFCCAASPLRTSRCDIAHCE